MRPLEIMRQVHIHVEPGDGVLLTAAAVTNLDRMVDLLDPDLVDRYAAQVGPALDVRDRVQSDSALFGRGLSH